ncbi:HlyD family secretion protein [uncultured Draconibacterium sp.]|uniref:HlyD family secretion protein n=1 Tax=uncultured Draconibacterium sp. TaxID=1573823 RepID=UPI0029C6A06F|nr:HlyD family secretion protein [uncultured Draconibacterium sp.]
MASSEKTDPKEQDPVENKQQETPAKKSPVKKISLIVLIITVIIFIINVLSDRHTPHTDQARVKGLVLPVAPMVSGYIVKTNVTQHSRVKTGDTLFIIDPTSYEIAVKVAESNLEKAIQSVDAGESSLKSAQARLSRAKVKLERSTKNWERTQRVLAENEGALSEADIDRSEASYLEAIEQVKSSQADLERQTEALGPLNESNPTIKSALNNLENAQINLGYTAVIAPSDGIVESFNIEEGYFAAAGHSLISLVSNNEMWIQANLKENNLSKVEPGDKVELIFDIEPGKVFEGKLTSISYGVSVDNTNPNGLPKVSSAQGWLRDPQRFPVMIELEDKEIVSKLRQGSQAEIVVYTGKKPLLNMIARLRIRIMSKLSYVR